MSQAHKPAKSDSPPHYKGGDPQKESIVACVDDERILKVIAETARDLLLSLPPPMGGWTKYKLHDHIYSYLNSHAQPNVPIIRKEVYHQTWENLRTKFNALKGTNDGSLDEFVFSALEEIRSAIASGSTKLPFLSDDTLHVWHCHQWLFPHHAIRQLSDKTGTSDPFETIHSQPDTFAGSPLFIANCPLPSHMCKLWNSTGVHFCADGAANRLHDWALLPPQFKDVDSFIPNYIIGDLDSVRPEVQEYYKHKGCDIHHIHDQDSTDLEKTLSYFSSLKQYADYKNLIITGCMGGNFSQEMAVYHACWSMMDRQIMLIGENAVVLFLAPGKHHISSPKGAKCGIVPLGEPCLRTTTTGLKWNLNNDVLQFGCLLSSSNETSENSVTIENSHPLIWTFDIAPSGF